MFSSKGVNGTMVKEVVMLNFPDIPANCNPKTSVVRISREPKPLVGEMERWKVCSLTLLGSQSRRTLLAKNISLDSKGNFQSFLHEQYGPIWELARNLNNTLVEHIPADSERWNGYPPLPEGFGKFGQQCDHPIMIEEQCFSKWAYPHFYPWRSQVTTIHRSLGSWEVSILSG